MDMPKGRFAIGAVTVIWIAAAVSLLIIFYPPIFLRFPPVWPDEGLFGNPVINWINKGKLATTLIGNLLQGMDVRTYWMPPAYFVALAGWFKGFGIGIAQMRAMSGLFGLLSAIAVAGLFNRAAKTPFLPILAGSLTVLDYVFIRAATIGRMDIMAVFFEIAGIYAYIKAEEIGDNLRKHRIAMGLSGILAGLAVMFHPMGAVAGAAILVHLALRMTVERKLRSDFFVFLTGFCLTLVPWLIYIAQDVSSFTVQFGGQLARKAGRNPLALQSIADTLSMNFSQYGSAKASSIAASAFAAIGLLKLDGRLKVIAYCGIFTLLAVIWSREMWYGVYLVPFISIGLAALIYKSIPAAGISAKKTLMLIGSVLVTFWYLTANTAMLASTSAMYSSQRTETDYGLFCRAISEELPAKSRILLACIPDPYMGLSGRSDLTIYHFVPGGVPVDQSEYFIRLQSLDYIVTGRDPITAEIGDFLRTNGSLVSIVGTREGSGYYGEIYKVFPDSGVF